MLLLTLLTATHVYFLGLFLLFLSQGSPASSYPASGALTVSKVAEPQRLPEARTSFSMASA